jgi:hypothetical protein
MNFMKKALILAIFSLGFFFAPKALASTTPATVPSNAYFFGDGKGYDENMTEKYFCFGNEVTVDCYNLEGVFVFVRQVQAMITDLQNQINNLQNQVSQIPSQPAPVVVEVPDEGVVECSGGGQYVNCRNKYKKTNVYATKVVFDNGTVISTPILILPGETEQIYRVPKTWVPENGFLTEVHYTVNGVEQSTKFAWKTHDGGGWYIVE